MAKKKKSWFNIVKRFFVWDSHSTQEKVFFFIYLKIISFEIDSVYSNDKENLNIFRRRKEGNGYLEG